MTVIKLQDGKYEIERDENGLMVGMWRNGDFWKSGLELFAHAQVFHAALDEIERLSNPAHINMILHCPNCGEQHIDAPSDDAYDGNPPTWTNPPHRSHLCHHCGHVWRPADVPTNGVAEIKTKGKNDSPGITPPRTGQIQPSNDSLAALRDMLRAEVDRLIAGQAATFPSEDKARQVFWSCYPESGDSRMCDVWMTAVRWCRSQIVGH